MAIEYTQLAQLRYNATTPISIYQCGVGETVQIFAKVANVSAAPALLSIYHDHNGSTYDQSTALVYQMKMSPGDLFELDHVFINNPSGNLAYQSSVANALIITVYGVVRT